MNARKALPLLLSTLLAAAVSLLVAVLARPEGGAAAPAAPAAGRAARPSRAPSGAALDPAVLARARAATIFVQVRNVSCLDAAEADADEGSGTGFFVSPDGRVATGWHVVVPVKGRESDAGPGVPARPDGIKVIVRSGERDQRVFPARLLAADKDADLALLKVEARDCQWLPLGEPSELVETAPVWVLGYPLGRAFSVLQRGPGLSVNSGHVSSLRRDDRGGLERVQFDAAVLPGNSGGPLISPDGRVLGVAVIALGTSRVNFAVPVGKLRRLLEECPPDRAVGEGCALEVVSDPPGAVAWLDSEPLGRAPLTARVRGGWRRLVVSAPGRRSWAANLAVHDGRKVQARLEPLAAAPMELAGEAAPEPQPPAPPMKPGKQLFAEDFSDQRRTDSWRQDTGGGQERTWYVQDGRLHQFSDDGLLHAVLAEGPDCADAAFSARVNIEANGRDGRAGLIFRSGTGGFALYRLHRGQSKVQLAYHSTSPFGWLVLAERKLPFEVRGGDWYRMEVQALGDQVVCLLDGKVVLEAALAAPPGGAGAAGGFGFYSVDSRASFDDAAVREVSAGEHRPCARAGLRSFWLTDQFESDSGFWEPAAKGLEPGQAPPWAVLPGGCLQPDEKAAEARNMLAGFDFQDLQLTAQVSCPAGTAGLVFRQDGERYYLFTLEGSGDRARLALVEGGKQRELAAARGAVVRRVLAQSGAGAGRAAGGPLTVFVQARGKRLCAGIGATELLQAEDDTLRHGRVGLYVDGGRAVFHGVGIHSGEP